MIYKIKTSETWEVNYDDQTWFLTLENELDTGETFYIVSDINKNEIEDEDLLDEIIDYWEKQTGNYNIDPWEIDEENNRDTEGYDWEESYI